MYRERRLGASQVSSLCQLLVDIPIREFREPIRDNKPTDATAYNNVVVGIQQGLIEVSSVNMDARLSGRRQKECAKPEKGRRVHKHN